MQEPTRNRRRFDTRGGLTNSGAMQRDQLVGRDEELQALGAFVVRPAAGLPAALILEGEAGIGKTALWLAAVDHARSGESTVLVSIPAQREARLAFAALADLVDGVWADIADELAEPQRAALEQALLLREGTRSLPDERAVAFGFLGFVRALARTGPVTIAIDDVQWLDPSSAATLKFTLRRLRAEPVRVLLARRLGENTDPDPFELERAPNVPTDVLAIGALTLGALHRLLRVRLGHALTRPALSRIHAASRGNPLHAIELARALEAPEHRGEGSLQGLLAGRVASLPEETRTALLYAALATSPTLTTLTRAGIGSARNALEQAVVSDLVSVRGDLISLAHPLVASAAAETAGDEARRSAHRALAEAAGSAEDRARHLGNGALGPSEEIAAALEEAAQSTRRRGARAVSAELFAEAASLTPEQDPRSQGRRLVEAGRAFFEAGDADRAAAVLTRVTVLLEEGTERVEADWRLGTILDETGRWQEATQRWQAALVLAGSEPLRPEILGSLAITTVYTGSITQAAAFAEDAIAAAEQSGRVDQISFALAARAFIGVLAGERADWKPLLDRALALAPEDVEGLGEWSPKAIAAECARHTGDIQAAHGYYTALFEQAVAVGDAGLEQWGAFGLGSTIVLLGDYQRASELADTVRELAEQTGVMKIPALILRALVDAHLGNLASADALAADAIEAAEAEAERMHLYNALAAAGFSAASGNDNPRAASLYARARETARPAGIAHATALRTFLQEAEAAAAAGLVAQADEALAAFEQATRGISPDWATVPHARAVASISAARGDLVSAAQSLEQCLPTEAEPLPLEAARAHLLLGSLRRRSRSHLAARVSLVEAQERFASLGALAWAAIAGEELSRIPGRTPRVHDELTDAERRIAELVASGRSNKEAATALHVSVKTVEVTLTRVYRKLGVRSRSQLAARFAIEPKE